MKQLKEVDQALREATEARDVPGVVAIAATGSEIIYQARLRQARPRQTGRDDARYAYSGSPR